MTGRCDGKPDHYEKNRRFRHLIPVLIGRSRSAKRKRTPQLKPGQTSHCGEKTERRGRIRRAESRTRESKAWCFAKVRESMVLRRDMWQTSYPTGYQINLRTPQSDRCSSRKNYRGRVFF
ncbi:hypothetical protein TNCT_513361 [Trichonephila clavata]|uniref:Uncharacterized protein n=1 Tax=Trichonephila clavata TaxID=2740835 RepID=A0A8X6EY85_TRICU|nr:hypothetical protein TNCT_513361 [Trichonephila clavata]